MAILSAQFRTDNTILFTAPIVSTRGITIKDGEGSPVGTLGGGDYLDLNSNEQADFTQRGRSCTFTEPNLTIPLATLKNEATTNGHGEVLTADVLGKEFIQDVKVSWGVFVGGPKHDDRYNLRSLGTLVNRFAPLDANASFAIDTTKGEFLVFKPKA